MKFDELVKRITEGARDWLYADRDRYKVWGMGRPAYTPLQRAEKTVGTYALEVTWPSGKKSHLINPTTRQILKFSSEEAAHARGAALLKAGKITEFNTVES